MDLKVTLRSVLPTGCCHGKIQSDLPNPSLLKRAIGPHQEGFLWPSHEVHWIPCWLGSYISSSSLMTFIRPPFSDLLAWSDYWLCFYSDTSWCSFTCCLAGPHYILSSAGRVCLTGLTLSFVVLSLSTITTSIALSTRTNALSVCGISKPP